MQETCSLWKMTQPYLDLGMTLAEDVYDLQHKIKVLLNVQHCH